MIYSSSGCRAYGIKSFVFDSFDDMMKEDNAHKGDTAFIIETSQYYMLNHNNVWVEIFPYGTGESGGGTSTQHVIYDGGTVKE